MARMNKVVTSQIEARTTDDRIEPNTYTYTSTGVFIRHDEDRVGQRVVGPGVLYGANKDSADQSGLNTIKLIPNNDFETDQFIIVEPTGPNHIHIRAGGTQDASTADLILGAENTNVIVSDGGNSVEINSSGSVYVNAPLQLNNSLILTTAAPESSVGQPGDLQGMVIFSSTHVYYCVSDYVNNSTNIWKRIAWSNDTWGA